MQNRVFPARVMLLASILATIIAGSPSLARDESAASANGGQRLREGTRLVEVTGNFVAIGDRANFVIAESGESVRVLENLTLQRVSRVLPQIKSGTKWTVNGLVTEYNNSNYLLLTKAIQIGSPGPKESAPASGIGTRPKVDYPKTKQGKSGAKNQESTDDSHP